MSALVTRVMPSVWMSLSSTVVRKAIEAEGRLARIEGDWWQYSLTARTEDEPSAISLLRISRDRSGGLEVQGRSWQEDGALSARGRWSVEIHYESLVDGEWRRPCGDSRARAHQHPALPAGAAAAA